MKISIIIPVYNTEKYLPFCLESIINQTHKDLEIIIVNDGSKDNSLQIIQEYMIIDSRIILIDQNNQGLSAARNVGMKNSSSDYIMFVDSDDYLSLECCEHVNKELERCGCDVLIFGRQRFWDNFDLVKYDKIQKDMSEYSTGMNYLLDHMAEDTFFASAWAKVYKTDLLKRKSIIFEHGMIYEDLLFVFKSLLCAQGIKLIDKPFYFYRQSRPDSIVNTIKEKDKDVLLTIDLLENFILSEAPSWLELKEFRLLIYRWICSAVVIKYPCMAPFSRKANSIVRYVIHDIRFKKYIRYVASNDKIGLKWKASAWLALNCYPIYVISVYGLYLIKKKLR